MFMEDLWIDRDLEPWNRTRDRPKAGKSKVLLAEDISTSFASPKSRDLSQQTSGLVDIIQGHSNYIPIPNVISKVI